MFLDRYRELGHVLSGNEKSKQAIRVNSLRSSNKEVQENLETLGVELSKIPYLSHGYTVDSSPFSLGASIEYLLGLFSIQESASQLPVQVMDPSPGEMNWDMCAAPGGKTTQMADYMMNKGVIYAVEIDNERIYSLENNIERCGVKNCLVYHADSTLIRPKQKFDKILLDAPCSGNYVVDIKWFEKRSLDDVKRNAETQRRLLSNSLNHLKEGGTLIYSTCSLEPEENELNIQWLLDNYEVTLESVEGPGNPGITAVEGIDLDSRIMKCMRFWPDELETQGFFIAKVINL
jgi:NOL1/NOP2/sun family putative RNA methylase